MDPLKALPPNLRDEALRLIAERYPEIIEGTVASIATRAASPASPAPSVRNTRLAPPASPAPSVHTAAVSAPRPSRPAAPAPSVRTEIVARSARPATPALSARPAPPPLLAMPDLSVRPAPSARSALPAPSAQNRASKTVLADSPMPPATDAPSRRSSVSISDTSESDMDFEVQRSERDSSSDADDAFQVVGMKKRKRLLKAASPTQPPPKKPSATLPTPPPAPRRDRPPPVVIQEKQLWDRVSSALRAKRINFTSARNTQQGISVTVPTSDDHRQLTRFLRAEKIGFHTYALEEERHLRVVIRGVPKELQTDAILSDLQSQGIPALEVHRLYKGHARIPYDLALVVLPLSPEGKRVFNVKTVCDISGLSIEAPHKRGSVGQCHRCQLYGHSARNCHARPRCVKCHGDHGTSDCARTADTTEPPGCVLCGELGHPANYRGCPKAPRRNRRVERRNRLRRAPSRARAPSAPRRAAPSTPSAPPKTAPAAPAPPAPSAPRKPAPSAPAKPAPSAPAKPAPSAPTKSVLSAPNRAAPSAPAKSAPSAPPAAPRPNAWSKPLYSSRPQKPPTTPSTSLQADLALVQDFLKCFDIEEITVLAEKIRRSNNDAFARLAIISEHADLFNALADFHAPSKH